MWLFCSWDTWNSPGEVRILNDDYEPSALKDLHCYNAQNESSPSGGQCGSQTLSTCIQPMSSSRLWFQPANPLGLKPQTPREVPASET